MQSKASTVKDYLKELPEERQKPVAALRKEILANLPPGFVETMNYGMIGYVVPHTLYPDGYHCKPADPLPFMNLASQKNYISVYHMYMYSENELGKWFIKEFEKLNLGKLDMGKCCIRFKKIDKIPYKLIGELAGKITPKEWISQYEKTKPAK